MALFQLHLHVPDGHVAASVSEELHGNILRQVIRNEVIDWLDHSGPISTEDRAAFSVELVYDSTRDPNSKRARK